MLVLNRFSKSKWLDLTLIISLHTSTLIRFLGEVVNNNISFTLLTICNFIKCSNNTSCIIDSGSDTYFRWCFLYVAFLEMFCFESTSDAVDSLNSICDVLMSEDIPVCYRSLIWSIRLSNQLENTVSIDFHRFSTVEHASLIPS